MKFSPRNQETNRKEFVVSLIRGQYKSIAMMRKSLGDYQVIFGRLFFSSQDVLTTINDWQAHLDEAESNFYFHSEEWGSIKTNFDWYLEQLSSFRDSLVSSGK